MATKLKLAPITLKDLNEHLAESTSDFGFELNVLRELRSHHLACEHGGHYVDPVTNKSREFDIRALYAQGNYRIRLAVECKNIRENYPLLVSLVPRQLDEAYHVLAHMSKPSGHVVGDLLGLIRQLRFSNSGLYPPNAGVVKSTTQVGRLEQSSALTSADSDIYEKWGQALASAADLVTASAEEAINFVDGSTLPSTMFTAVVPILVVPNGRLWAVNYDAYGSQIGEPQQVRRASHFVGKDYPLRAGSSKTLEISHMEIVTFDGLFELINLYLRDLDLMIPDAALSKVVRSSNA